MAGMGGGGTSSSGSRLIGALPNKEKTIGSSVNAYYTVKPLKQNRHKIN
jgi:hypothetical protein